MQHNHPFPTTSRPFEGRRIIVHKLACRLCSATEEINAAAYNPLPEDACRKKFQQLGWEVGHNRQNDLCPAHSKKHRTIRSEEAAPVGRSRETIRNMPDLGAALRRPTVPAPAAAPTHFVPQAALPKAGDPPAEMSIDDRRIIFAKLNEVYLGPEKGYADTCTDASVARDLGVPRGWVSSVRDEFFGPVKENDEIRLLRELVEREVNDIRAKADALEQSAKETADQWRTRADKITARMDAVEKSLK